MSNNSVPYEIIGYPVTIWRAPVGTAFPELDDEPAAPWAKIGTSGDLNYMRDGVKVQHSQSTNKFRALGDTGARKIFRQEEDLTISVVLADLTLEQYKHALNDNAITTQTGAKKIGLSRGSQVATMALLVRGPSPYGDDMNMQYEVPRAAQTGSPEVVFQNGEAAGLELVWDALVDPDAASADERFGRLRAQTDEDAS